MVILFVADLNFPFSTSLGDSLGAMGFRWHAHGHTLDFAGENKGLLNHRGHRFPGLPDTDGGMGWVSLDPGSLNGG